MRERQVKQKEGKRRRKRGKEEKDGVNNERGEELVRCDRKGERKGGGEKRKGGGEKKCDG